MEPASGLATHRRQTSKTHAYRVPAFDESYRRCGRNGEGISGRFQIRALPIRPQLDPQGANAHIGRVGTRRLRVPTANWQRWLPLVKRRLRRDPARGPLSMTFRPLHDRVLVRRIEAAQKTPGGIIIPDTAQEKPQEGEIVSVGSGTRSEEGNVTPLDVKAGDKILFGKWSGSEVKLDGEDLLIMKEADILGVLG